MLLECVKDYSGFTKGNFYWVRSINFDFDESIDSYFIFDDDDDLREIKPYNKHFKEVK